MPYQIPTAGIEDSAVNAAKIATDAVGTTEIISDGVRTADIQNSAVTTAKINNSAVITDKLNDAAVTTDKLNDASVTLAKCETSLTNALVPVGGIIMYFGTESNIPTNWKLCDGQNGTPDLRNRFVIAADDYNTTPNPDRWETSVTGSATQSGGSKDGTLGTHDHTITVSGGGASGTFLTGASLSQSTAGPFQYGGDAVAVSGTSLSTSSGSVSSTALTATASQEGSSLTNANLPPYFALAYIMRAS